jgi:competence protein ComEC
MKGYWHIAGLAVGLAALSVILNQNFVIFLIFWLSFLYITRRLSLLPFLLSISLFLFFTYYLPEIDQAESFESESIFITGKVAEPPLFQSDRIEVVLHDEASSLHVMVTYFMNTEDKVMVDSSFIRYGAECQVQGDIEMPPQVRNPGEFDYSHYLRTQNIDAQMMIDNLSDLNCVGTSFWDRFLSLRYDAINEITEKMSHYTASWANALVLGDTSLLDEEIVTLFQDWGLSHILAISGLHIGIVVGIVYLLLIKTGLFTKEKAEIIVLIFLPIYAILAGGAPSVLRASMMVVLFLSLRRLKVELSALDVISMVFLFLLLIDPYLIYQIGFQFSFIVTFAIILSRKWLASVTSPIYQILIIGFISQMAILPIQLNYFYLFQPLSILLNLVIVPYFSIFVIPLMFLLFLFSFLPDQILQSIDLLFIGIHQQVIQSIQWIDEWLNSPLYLAELPGWFFVLYYFLFILSIILIERKDVMKSFISFVLLTVLTFGYAAVPYYSSEGAVTMLDIGQGDAILIELPYKKGTIMIDAGATFSFDDFEASPSVYERKIKPYLKSNGIYQIDALFLTHEDMDHIGSAIYMIEDDMVEQVYISEYFNIPDEIMLSSIENNIPIYRISAGDVINYEGQSFEVLAPLQDRQSVNENSLVLYTEIGGKSWLFTGDIGKEEERQLLEHYRFQADILKVAHHGSNTSTDIHLLEAINSEAALISVGKDNSYGHPSQEVIEALERFEIEVYRTDEDGAIQYRFNDNVGSFFPYLSN